MKKFIPLVICSLLFLIFSTTVVAEPEYTVVVRLDDKSVSNGESFTYKIVIQGGGVCNESILKIIPEGTIDPNSALNLRYYNGNNEGTQIGLENTITATCPEQPEGELRNTEDFSKVGGITYLLNQTLNDENLQQIEGEGRITTSEDSEGGDYIFSAILICKNNNKWYTFIGTNEYHVRKGLENGEYWINLSLVLLTLITVVISFFQLKKKEDIIISNQNLILQQFKYERNITHEPNKSDKSKKEK